MHLPHEGAVSQALRTLAENMTVSAIILQVPAAPGAAPTAMNQAGEVIEIIISKERWASPDGDLEVTFSARVARRTRDARGQTSQVTTWAGVHTAVRAQSVEHCHRAAMAAYQDALAAITTWFGPGRAADAL